MLLSPYLDGTCSFYTTSIQILEIGYLNKDIYVFCRDGLVPQFDRLLEIVLTTPHNTFSVQGNVEVYKVLNQRVMTSKGVLTCMDVYDTNDVSYKTTLYLLRTKDDWSRESMMSWAKRLELSFPYIFIYVPKTAEGICLLSRLFESKECIGSRVGNINITTIVPATDLGEISSTSHVFAATGFYTIARNKNFIERLSTIPDTGYTVEAIRSLPIIYIDLISTSNMPHFHPTDEIRAIMVTLVINDVMHHHVLFVSTLEYTLPAPTKRSLICYTQFANETSMLERFILLYAECEMLRELRLPTGLFHKFCMVDVSKKMVYIIERCFYRRLGQIASYIYAHGTSIALSKYSMMFAVGTNAPPDMILFDSIVVDAPSEDYVFPVAYSRIAVVKNEREFTANSVDKYKHLAEEEEFMAYTFLGVAKQLVKVAKHNLEEFMTTDNIEMMLEESRITNTSISHLRAAPVMEMAASLLFNYYLSQAVFLLPGQDLSYVNLHYDAKIAIDQSSLLGGYVYSSNRCLYRQVCHHFDFKSFYPSIMAAFGISFNTVQVVFSADEPVIRRYRPSICDAFRVFKLDQTRDLWWLKPGVCAGIKEFSSASLSALFAGLVSCRDHNKRYKDIANKLIGCFGNHRFEYFAPHVYQACTYFGRRVIQFVTSFLRRFDTLDFDAAQLADRFWAFDMSTSSPCGEIINVQTDGFCCTELVHSPETFVANVNKMLAVATSTEWVRLCHKFKTDYLAEVGKNEFYARIVDDTTGKVTYFGKKHSPAFDALLEKSYHDKTMQFEDLFKRE